MSSRASSASKYVDAQGRTDAELYLMGILDGSIVSGKKMIQLAEKLLPRFKDGYKQWHFDAEAAIRPVEFIERFLCIPSGKLNVPFVMEQYERAWTEIIFGFVDDEGVRQFQYALVEVARKNGKACTISTQLPTPKGWRTMGEIHPGDYVFGQDGKPSLVIAESEIFDKPTYRVTFEDGATVDTSGDHIWTVQTKESRKVAKYVPKTGRRYTDYREGGWFETTTKEMLDSGIYHARRDGKGKEYKYRVPIALPVEYEEKFLPIDPYTFGYWLGDGHSNGPYMTIGKQDLDESIGLLEGFGHTCSVRLGHENTYKVTLDTQSGRKANPFTSALRDMFVLNNKHIPDMYLQASVEQRWELLRGLMDTDGYVSKAGQCQFTQKRKELTEQFVELCSSLGIKANMHEKNATCNGKDCGIVYVVEFWTDKDHSCFHLKRKHARLKDKLADRMKCKSIVSIERIPNEPTKCIAIDNPSHLYLAGRQYTATHNTSWAAALHIYMLVASGEFAPQNYCLASSKSQASLAHGAVWRMVRQSPLLQKYLRKGIVTERAETGIVCDKNMGYCIPLSKQSSHLDGLDVYFALADELSSWESRANYDLIRQGMAARKSPALIVISTESFAVDSIWTHEKDYAYQWLDGKIEDDRFVPFLYEQDDRSEVWSGNPEVFKKSNPGLGTVKNLDFLLAQITKAQNDSSYRSTLYIKDFNIRATAASAFLTYEEACNDTPYVFDTTTFRYGICGIDASDTLDLSCCTFLFMKSGDDHIYRKSMYWISEEQVKDNMRGTQRGRDGVPYLEWADRGFLRIVPGNRVDHRCFIEYIEEMADLGLYTRAIGFDRWGMREILPDMKMLVGEQNVIPIAFGAQSLSQPMKQLKSDMKMGRIIDGGNPIDHWCNMNVTGKWDINGSVQPVKLSGPTSRIDGFAALLCAYKVLAFERWDDYQAAIS